MAENPKPYRWTAIPEAILTKAAKAKALLGTLLRKSWTLQ
jgi:hypothetical protein